MLEKKRFHYYVVEHKACFFISCPISQSDFGSKPINFSIPSTLLASSPVCFLSFWFDLTLTQLKLYNSSRSITTGITEICQKTYDKSSRNLRDIMWLGFVRIRKQRKQKRRADVQSAFSFVFKSAQSPETGSDTGSDRAGRLPRPGRHSRSEEETCHRLALRVPSRRRPLASLLETPILFPSNFCMFRPNTDGLSRHASSQGLSKALFGSSEHADPECFSLPRNCWFALSCVLHVHFFSNIKWKIKN